MSAKKLLIIDVDTGTDDAQAIMLALSHEGADVLAITCVHGNVGVDQVCLNTLRVLKECGRLDVPVFRGAAYPLLGPSSLPSSSYYHGRDGLGDAPDSDAPSDELVQNESAVDALLRLSRERPGEITLVTLAPLTNVALALRLDRDFGKRLKEVVIMGGNMSAVGNIEQCKEYNFYCDPEAAYVTLNELSCEVTLLPLEPTITDGAPSYEWFEREILPLTSSKAMFHHKIITITDRNRRDYIKRCAVCDVNAMAIALEESLVTKATREYCTVELGGNHTRSMLVVDWKHHLKKPTNVLLIQEYDLSRFQQLYKNMFL